jgi:surface protein
MTSYYYGDIWDWNTSMVTNMSYIFQGKSSFNEDISGWDVSRVTTMYKMFNGAYNFNSIISTWNVGKVTNFGYMLCSVYAFNSNPCDGMAHYTWQPSTYCNWGNSRPSNACSTYQPPNNDPDQPHMRDVGGGDDDIGPMEANPNRRLDYPSP